MILNIKLKKFLSIIYLFLHFLNFIIIFIFYFFTGCFQNYLLVEFISFFLFKAF